jgi:peptide/nickel transport system ATP-binding protein
MIDKKILLEIKNLTVRFQTEDGLITAINNISFKLHRGETVGIVGESGSGKSVTSLSIMRLLNEPPANIAGGEILYHKENGDVVNLLALSEEDMRQYRGNEIAMIFQEPMTSLNPVHRCGAQVMEAILNHQNVSKSEARKQTIAQNVLSRAIRTNSVAGKSNG